MNQRYKTFNFLSYTFDPLTKKLDCSYQFDVSTVCTESYIFDFEFTDYDPSALDSALQLLFYLAGVSYYKMYLPPNIEIQSGKIGPQLSRFLSETYQKGLGEYFYTNKLDPNTPVKFPANVADSGKEAVQSDGLLVSIGGGKDSLLSIEMLRDSGLDIATWSVGHRKQLAPLVEQVGLPHYFVERILDPNISSLNAAGAMNGHIPISAIFAAVGTVVAILTGRRDIVLSNEQSSNEATLDYHGTAINHQYSKSQDFEKLYQKVLDARFGDSIRYYSLLRPYTELRIAELFAKTGFEKYKDVFSSCNRAFRQGESHLYWCGECSKCAFVFLILAPFVDRAELEGIFGGKNLLLDTNLETTYKQLLGIEGDKPLDCVGTIAESRTAMRIAQTTYPELSKFVFDIDPDYDYKKIHSDLMPDDIHEIVHIHNREQ